MAKQSPIYSPKERPEEVIDFSDKQGWIMRHGFTDKGAPVILLYFKKYTRTPIHFSSIAGARFWLLSYFDPDAALRQCPHMNPWERKSFYDKEAARVRRERGW